MTAHERNTNPSNQITHITLNSGHVCDIPPGKFDSDSMRMFSQLVEHGGGLIPGHGGMSVVISQMPGCAFFDIYDASGRPVLLNAMTWSESDAARLWNGIKRCYSSIADLDEGRSFYYNTEYPKMPSVCPWLVSWILPASLSLVMTKPETLMYLGAFEQGIATAIIKIARSSNAN